MNNKPFLVFDINGTICAYDSTDNDKTIKENAIKILDKHYEKYLQQYLNNKLNKNEILDIIIQHMNNKKIFTSFIKVLQQFYYTGKYRIMLRTFGNDGIEIINSINHNYDYYSFDRIDTNNTIIYDMKNKNTKSINLDKQKLKIFMDNVTSDLVLIHDDYYFWNRHDKQSHYGKSIFDTSNYKIFFDDNNCVTCEKLFYKVNTLQAMIDENYFINIINNIN